MTRLPWEQQIYFLKTARIRIYWLLGPRFWTWFKYRRDGAWGVIRFYRFVILWDFIPRSLFEDATPPRCATPDSGSSRGDSGTPQKEE